MEPRRRGRRERAQRGGDVRRLRVVDVAHAADRRDLLDAVRDARERRAPARSRRRRRRRARGRRGRRCVLAVVRARDRGLRRQRVVAGELDPPRRPGYLAEAARDDGDVVRGLVRERAQLRGGVRPRTCACRSRWSGSRLRARDARTQRVRVLELERRELADDPRIARRPPDERRQRPADVAGHLGAHGRPREASRRAARSSSSSRSCPVTATIGLRQQARADLDLAPDRRCRGCRAASTSSVCARDSGALDDDVDAVGGARSSASPSRTSTPASTSRSISISRERSCATTSTPAARSASEAACPERASPSTSARRGRPSSFTAGSAGSSGRRGRSRARRGSRRRSRSAP